LALVFWLSGRGNLHPTGTEKGKSGLVLVLRGQLDNCYQLPSTAINCHQLPTTVPRVHLGAISCAFHQDLQSCIASLPNPLPQALPASKKSIVPV